jgi:hypothetical protein
MSLLGQAAPTLRATIAPAWGTRLHALVANLDDVFVADGLAIDDTGFSTWPIPAIR